MPVPLLQKGTQPLGDVGELSCGCEIGGRACLSRLRTIQGKM